MMHSGVPLLSVRRPKVTRVTAAETFGRCHVERCEGEHVSSSNPPSNIAASMSKDEDFP